MNPKKIFLHVFCWWPIYSMAQISVDGKISAGDSIQLMISSATPTEFPKIEALFRAEDLNGYPYWGLDKQDVVVLENNQPCTVFDLHHYSEEEPINISIVVDHSSSMSFDMVGYLDYYNNDTLKAYLNIHNGTGPEIVSPLNNAVLAVKGFLQNFNNEKDRVGLYAFDQKVDVQKTPTTNIADIEASLDSLKPTGSTAFFDAVYVATKSLTELDGIRVVIALTDGQDNASKKSSKDVIFLAKEHDIPVYCIGLGSAMSDTLRLIAEETKGYYGYTRESSALDSIYSLLNKKILAYYLMTYESVNWSSQDQSRDLAIQFNLSDIYIEDNITSVDLPQEVRDYLKEKEEREQQQYEYLIGGLVGGTFIILGLTAFVIRKKRKKRLQIKKLSNNPGDGICMVEVELGVNPSATLFLYDINGREVYKHIILSSGSMNLDFSHLSNGRLTLVLTTELEKSKPIAYFKL